MTVTVPVRPDGKISTPLVEDMPAVGKTPSVLARDIEKALAEYVKAPQVNVIVTVPVSVFSQVKVIGQVGGDILVVIYTRRGRALRIISARRANRKERAQWLSSA